MATITYDDWTTEEFNQEDFISKADLEENYISREELEDNYVTREKYEKKSKQAKEAFKNRDLAWRDAIAEREAELTKSIEDKISFKAKHGFPEIPEEISEFKGKHPDLSWEEAYRASWYTKPVDTNPNPWREDISDEGKKAYTTDELANLAATDREAYNLIAAKIEAWEIKEV